MPGSFAEIQERLGPALSANRLGSTTDHVMIPLPSYSVSESLLSHYGDRIPSLEHRYLNAILIAGRIPACEIVYVSSRAPAPEVVDYYFSLMPDEVRERVRPRIHMLEVDDGTPRSVAARLVEMPDRIEALKRLIGGRPAFIEPWNVTEHEVAFARAVGVPINGTAPELRHLGFKSEGRRLLRRAGVPVPLGHEDVRTIDDVVAATEAIRAEHPAAPGVVVKHDDSGAGDGNVVIDLGPMAAAPDPGAWLRATVAELPEWYRTDLERGGVVEERITGTRFTSPSAQVDIRPDGSIAVLATHEQILGGPGDQVYLGCRFPADPAYAPELARHATAIGEELSRHGAMGRFSVDFVGLGHRRRPVAHPRPRGQPSQGGHDPPVRDSPEYRPRSLRSRAGGLGEHRRWLATRVQRDGQPRRRAVARSRPGVDHRGGPRSRPRVRPSDRDGSRPPHALWARDRRSLRTHGDRSVS
ncbi:MAG: hypothetical protein L0227_19550 [Chloroflexi bacterium]|nr:hypothetical protein [Chloroflexota bacterium]